jgi:hypothetical protein
VPGCSKAPGENKQRIVIEVEDKIGERKEKEKLRNRESVRLVIQVVRAAPATARCVKSPSLE